MDVTNLAVWWRRRKNAVPSERLASSGTLIGHAEGSRPIVYPAPSVEQAQHTLIAAGSGSGKTALEANLCTQEIEQSRTLPPEHRPCFFVLDLKGDLIQGIVQGISAVAPERLADVRYLNPFQGGFPFNLVKLPLGETPVDIRCTQLAGLIAVTSTATGAQAHLGAGSRQIDAITHVNLGCHTTARPDASLIWGVDAFLAPDGLKQLAALTTNRRAKQFLEAAHLSEELRSSCASRMRAALAASETLEKMIASPDCLSLADLFLPGNIVLCDLGKPIGGPALQRFHANLYVRLAVEHLMERPSPFPGHHVRLIIDECHIVAPVLSDVAEQVLTVGRSKNLSLTLITQQTALLGSASDTLLGVLWANCPTKILGRLSASDANLISREITPTRGTGERLHAVQSRFAASVATLRDREFFWMRPGGIRERFTSLTIDVHAWQEAAERQESQIAAARKRLALPGNQPPRVTLAEASPVRPRSAQAARPAAAGRFDSASSAQPRRSRWG